MKLDELLIGAGILGIFVLNCSVIGFVGWCMYTLVMHFTGS